MTNNHDTIRVHYYERQFLRTQDFHDEQAYHIAMRRRHNIAHHEWGIVNGLELKVDDDSNFWVMPGVAVDGYGRELILAQKQQLPKEAFVNKDSNELDVLLFYNRSGSDQPSAGYEACDDNGRDDFYRWQESPILRLEQSNPTITDWRKPKIEPESELDFSPEQKSPDDPVRIWPVFLGKIIQDLSDDKEPFSADMNGRPYAGLVGAKIITPSKQAEIQLGGETQDDKQRFALRTQNKEQKLETRLEVDHEGPTTIHGDAQIKGSVTLKAGAVKFGTNAVEVESPWTIQRIPNDTGQQLRLSIERDGSGTNQFIIGTWSAEEEAFIPCLTIDDQKQVKINGNLTVLGQLIETHPRTKRQLSVEALNFTAASGLAGMAGTSALLDDFYKPQFPEVVDLIADLLATSGGRQDLADQILELAQTEFEDFLSKMLAYGDLVETIIAKLVLQFSTQLIEALSQAQDNVDEMIKQLLDGHTEDMVEMLTEEGMGLLSATLQDLGLDTDPLIEGLGGTP